MVLELNFRALGLPLSDEGLTLEIVSVSLYGGR